MAIKMEKAAFAMRWYTPVAEQGKTDAAEFRLKPLTGAQRLEVMAGFDPKTKRFTGEAMTEALHMGVMDWKNVTDGEGKPKRFNYNELDKMPVDLLAELFAEVLAELDQSEAEAGES